MRRVQPGLVARLEKGKAVGVTAFVTTAGLSSIPFASLGVIGWWVLWTVLGFSGAVGLGAAYARGRFSYIPKIVVDEMGRDKGCVCKRLTAGELQQACEMTKTYYGHEYVDFRVAEKWRQANPDAFVQIVNESGEMCSCFGLIALKDSCFDEFIKGRVKDGEFEYDDVVGPKDTKKSPRLYLSGAIVSQAGTFIGRKRADMMCWVILDYYKRYFGLRKSRTIYSLAVSKEGEQILQAVGFSVVSKKNFRRDGCNLYSIQMSSAVWDQMSTKIPNWSHCYTVNL